MTLRAITIRQPYAQAICSGRKHYETRSWQLHYRGLIAIHAAKRPAVGDLPTGAIVAVATLADVVRVTTASTFSERERAHGDFTLGRFAWHLVDVRVLARPIPYAGTLGLWTVDEDTTARLMRELGR